MRAGDGLALGEDRGGGVEMLDVFDELQAGGDVERLHGALHARDQRGAGAEFIDAETEEQRRERDVAGHFAADADPEIVRVRGLARSCG